MLERYPLNDRWLFCKSFSDDMKQADYCSDDFEQVRLPHSCQLINYNYIDEEIYQMTCAYKKNLDLTWIDKPDYKRIFLYFEAAGHEATVYINGIEIFVHRGGYTSFRVEITDRVDFEKENTILIRLDSKESLNQPPFGNVIDFMTYGGLYREAYLEISGRSFLDDVYVHCDEPLSANQKLVCQFQINRNDISYCLEDYSVEMVLCKKGSSTELLNKRITKLESQQQDKLIDFQIIEKVPKLDLWNLDEPNQYSLFLRLFLKTMSENELLDEVTINFGVREAVFKKDGFYLNGEKILLRGLNRHQSYPYVGYAMPERAQKFDAFILKNELGVNAVRTAHYPQSRHFIEACDELGLLVFTEIPGWQHIGDQDWKNLALENIKEMILEYRNHPSIILWGVRINESQDDDEFYKQANQLAHKYDQCRQTGGVRFIQKSNLLEDVYTYNDFSHNGSNKGIDPKNKVTSDTQKGYLVSEYNGHMYPTKIFDDERHRLEHALRYARVLSDITMADEVAGGFGWCMADYNTHKDFGSGDQICYHGVLDMFRNKKLAADVFASQQDEPIMQISSAMNIGDHPGGYIGQVYAFTNMDKIKLYKNDIYVNEFYPNKKLYPGLIHPPVMIDDFIGDLLVTQEGYSAKISKTMKEVLYAVARYGQNGLPLRYKLKMAGLMILKGISLEEGTRLYYKYVGNWGDQVTSYRFEGLLDDKIVCVNERRPGKKIIPKIEVDSQELVEGDTYDVASVRIEVQDENSNRLYYYMEPLCLSVEGNIEIIGPNCISLKGGAGGTYIKTIGKTGSGILTIKGHNFCESIIFTVRQKV